MTLHEPARLPRNRNAHKLCTPAAEFLDLSSRRLSLVGEPEVIFERVGAVYQSGTDDEMA
jgi:hypothetical protein